jgi:hypothetical protein
MQTVRDLILEGLEKIAKSQNLSALEIEAFVTNGEEIFKKKVENYHNVKRLRTVRSNAVERIQEALTSKKDLIPDFSKFTDIEFSVVTKAAEVHRLTLNDALSRSRKRAPVDCRNQINAIMVLYLNCTTTYCGSLFNKDHSTVINCLKNHSALVETDRTYLSNFIRILNSLKETHPNVFGDIETQEGIKKYATQDYIKDKLINFEKVTLKRARLKSGRGYVSGLELIQKI